MVYRETTKKMKRWFLSGAYQRSQGKGQEVIILSISDIIGFTSS